MRPFDPERDSVISIEDTLDGPVVALGRLAGPAIDQRRGRTARVPHVPWCAATPASTPLHLLNWQSRYTPLVGRDRDKQALVVWATSGPGVLVRFLEGDAGVGKSRLAAEVADTLKSKGWSAGFVGWNDQRIWRIDSAGTLLILDDPPAEGLECCEDLNNALIESARGAASVRILLLSRPGHGPRRAEGSTKPTSVGSPRVLRSRLLMRTGSLHV